LPKFNDIDMENWKDSEVWTDSLWIIPQRDASGKHDGSYHGNFVPQIPHQLMLRYTRKDDVLDPFIGSGTSAFEAESQGRNLIGIDIRPDLVEKLDEKVGRLHNFFEFIVGDSADPGTFEQVQKILEDQGRTECQLAILHPPYHDIIRFSEDERDLSNAATAEQFLSEFAAVVKNTLTVLQKGGYLAIVIGDKYSHGQWHPLGFYCMNEVLQLGPTLKSVIVKNMEGNRKKRGMHSIWRYRALASDYYIFKHEYILVFKC
jgi:SAM-dependent methyltransferase